MENTMLVELLAKSVINILKGPSVTTDDLVFRLHYKFTFRALLFAGVLVFCYQFFRNSVRCLTNNNDIPDDLINDYCKLAGTFTLPGSFSKKVGDEVPYPGIDKYSEGQVVMNHTYYQSVCYMLFLQALLFRLPHLIWRKCESGRMEALVEKLKSTVLGQDETLPSYLAMEFNDRKNEHQCYAIKLLFCEVLNFLNVFFQFLLLNKFLGGQFSTFGVDVIRYATEEQIDRVDPMIRIFPHVTKCTFRRFFSGYVHSVHAICLMTLNALHAKIFLMMWFWFVILSVTGVCVLIYRMIVLCSRQARLRLLYFVSSFSSRSIIKSLVPTLSYGEWFSLYLLAKNIDNIHFRPFILQLKESRSDTSTLDRNTLHISQFIPKVLRRNNWKP